MSRPTTDHRSVPLLVVQVLLLVPAAVGLVLGVLLVATDEASHDDMWDGLGTWLGLVAAVPSLVVGVLAVVVLVLLRRSRPGPAAVVTGVEGLVLLLAAPASAGWFGSAGAVVALVVATVLLVPAAAVLTSCAGDPTPPRGRRAGGAGHR